MPEDVASPSQEATFSGKQPRRHRRVTTEPPPGSDPTPLEEPDRHAEGENDARMRADKPPHY